MKEYVELEPLPNKKDVKDFKMLKALSRAYKELNTEKDFKEIEIEKQYKKDNSIPIAQINLTKLHNRIENMDKHIQKKLDLTKSDLKKIIDLDLNKSLSKNQTNIIKNISVSQENLLDQVKQTIETIKKEAINNKKTIINELELVNNDINSLIKNQKKNNKEIELIKEVLYDLFKIEEIDKKEIKMINKKFDNNNEVASTQLLKNKKQLKTEKDKQFDNDYIQELENQLAKIEIEMINLNPVEYDIYKKKVIRLKKILKEKKKEMVS